ncbi:hypothetical protein QQF64_023846 [Cirrhinus molitorella]|uniref:Uncharacterized protein n=1 Tax=Cirrhinus molitorella TaxID=172907 RepID=A0ABR3NJK3_9TELE
MPKPPCDKDFPIFSTSDPYTERKIASTQPITCSTTEDQHGETGTPEAINTAIMDQILTEAPSLLVPLLSTPALHCYRYLHEV